MNDTFKIAFRAMFVAAMTLLAGSTATAQVHVKGNVFGGGNLADVGGSVTVNMTAGTVDNDVYGGGALANTNTSNWDFDGGSEYEQVNVIVNETVVTGMYTKEGDTYTKITENIKAAEGVNYYKKIGTWATTGINTTTGATTYTTTVNLTGGTINGDAYGGGLGRIAESVHYTQEEADAYNSEHNLSSGDEGFKTTADWLPEVKATVYGDINVILGKDDASSATKFYISKYTDEQHAGMVKSGRVFGCNNLNGSPQGNVTVTVWKTVKGNIGRSETADKNNTDATYEVAAVYGGGNLANYTTTGKKTHVIINGCDATSINYVYGGGNAAAVPQASVDVNAAYEIGYVFGGGNGKDDYTLDGNTWITNPGANVNGNANTMLFGGTIHEAFGGSNEKGRITGSVSINSQKGDSESANYCALKLGKLYGAGKNADIDGDLIVVMGCMPGEEDPTTEVYGGAENANVKGDVELTITSGSFRKVFGGNNQSGAIFGHIKLNIEESGCTPIKIDELYLGGYNAPYSVYGYKNTGTADAPVYVARTNKEDGTAVSFDFNEHTKPDETSGQYDDPELNIISATRIGKVFGGGLGSGAIIYGNPIVNINQTYPFQFDATTKNYVQKTTSELGAIGVGYKDENDQDVEGGIFGGGNEAAVYGNTTVNIGNKATVDWTVLDLNDSGQPKLDANERPISKSIPNVTVLGANIVGNVYGGGNLADVGYLDDDTKENDENSVYKDTNVNISVKEVTDEGNTVWQSVTPGTKGVTIVGNVYGGGKGEAQTFKCEKAMVVGNTNVRIGNGTIGNGTVGGNVYGGGEIARVEKSTAVTIGIGDLSTSVPIINGSVYGGGQGVNTHGYSGLVRGSSSATVQGYAKVRQSVYGGGETASVGRYNIRRKGDTEHTEVEVGMPYSLISGGISTVIIQSHAEIGPASAMEMPTFTGHVFGAGKGVLPYVGTDNPGRYYINDNDEYTWEAYGSDNEDDYVKYMKTLAINNTTDVTIKGNALVKGSVYGGSENGHVRENTHVKIEGGQIGFGQGATGVYADDAFIDPTSTTVTSSNALATCASWPYDKETTGKPYDKFADEEGNYPTGSAVSSSEGGTDASHADDGHTFYGNVFGGGSGYFPYAAGKWLRSAGSVGGNTRVDISGGHILSNVYGGNEQTDVDGSCTINMWGGTVGVPRTQEQIEDKPVIGNLFGAGKGDKRVLFNTWTNVASTSVNISGSAKIYGSVFGGGEDGHVYGDAVTNLGGSITIGSDSHPYSKVVIGSTGTSGADGNVFGGGRGSVTALTAGVVGGNVNLTIDNGNILGSVYGGGRLASVGTNFTNPTLENGDPDPRYGELQTPDADHGNITVTVNDGTIGSSTSTGVNGNIFGGSKGTETNWKLGIARSTTINMTGGTAYASVYGGGELAQVVGSHTTNGQVLGTEVNISGGTIGIQGKGRATWGNVYAGGKGNTTHVEAGLVKTNTKANISQAEGKTTTIYHNIYGGGAYGSVGTFDLSTPDNLSTYQVPYAGMPVNWATGTGTANVTITGGTIGTDGKENGMVFGSSRGDIAALGEIHDKLAWVNNVNITVGTDGSETGPQIKGSVYGSGENGHTYNNTEVTVYSGTIGIANSSDPGYSVTSDGTTYSGAEYPNRGNVYGGGCGTDKYYSGSVPTGHTANDGEGDTYNPLAGIVYGTTKVTIDGGQVVHNVYGAGAMGSVGKMTKDATTKAITFTSGGTTTIEISGGTIGVDGTKGDGNVFGAARGDASSAQTDVALVKTTDVTISGDATIVWGNVYGGGQIGCVGTFDETAGKYVWSSGGLSKVTVSGGKIGPDNNDNPEIGNVFGAGKGKANTFKCEKAMVRETIVSISDGTVNGNVYGGGEIGRVEENTEVTIGRKSGEAEGAGTGKPIINGSVFGAGKGKETHGYSALVRGNTTVTVEGATGAKVGNSVYGGGEIASVGRYGLDNKKMPEILVDGGYCYVKVLGNVVIGPTNASDDKGNVFGAGKGVNPAYVYKTSDRENNSKRMVTYDPTGRHQTGQGTLWDPYDDPDDPNDDPTHPNFVWEYFMGNATTGVSGEDEFKNYLETLALATHPEVTIGGNATVNSSVFGGGELGLTKGSVVVSIRGGTVVKDVYGGGSLANTNTTSTWAKRDAEGKPLPPDEHGNYAVDEVKIHPTTTVNLLGGSLRDAYGGGLGRLASTGVSAVEAFVYGDVKVELNNNNNGSTAVGTSKGCIVNRIFGCNNLNGSPKAKVQVYVYATQNRGQSTISGKTKGTYDVQAVYGGGNLSAYEPDDALLEYTDANKATVDAARTEVYIDGCDLTSIKQVYGGGNAASVPATYVLVNRAFEIDEVFGGGNGADDYSLTNGTNTVWYKNPGANVGYYDYTRLVTDQDKDEDGKFIGTGSGTEADPYKNIDKENARTKVNRQNPDNHYMYGSGIATTEIKGGTIHTVYGGSNSRGNVRTKLSSSYSGMFDDCPMVINTTYGSGKNAESDGEVEVLSDCAKGISVMFGGAENADVDNDINLIITNGSSLQRVFGGNNTSGAINGSITVTIKEGGCEPIRIGELYAGGFLAPYSIYGYKKTNGVYDTEEVEYFDENDNTVKKKLQRIPLESASEDVTPKANPRINVISATRIDNIFGGGYQAKLVGSPHINVNMEPGRILAKYVKEDFVGEHKDTDGNVLWTGDHIVTEDGPEKGDGILAIGTIGNVYGGGNMADIVGDTYVEIGTGTEHNDAGELVAITPARNAATITGNVFGGGKGKADTFLCEKAMIGKDGDGVNNPDGGTHVTIGNGTVDGNVYGGGEIGRVEKNTEVTIGLADAGSGESAPVIKGSVFGGGKGENEHGYAALVRGNPTVIIQADAKVEHNVYGGGEIASVARYKVPRTEADVAAAIAEGYDAHLGMPYALANTTSGNCTVTIKDHAVIGPDEHMKMYHSEITDGSDKPDDAGHVFGAGKGILPDNYTYEDKAHKPKRMVLYDVNDHPESTKGTAWEYVDPTDSNNKNVWEYFADRDAYIVFIQTLALSSYTNVTIGDDTGSKPFVKGSVYGGSENGLVQFDTKVYVKSGQIGCGKNATEPYEDNIWADGYVPTDDLECASWDYGKDTNRDGKKDLFAPYDPNANATGDLDQYPAVNGQAAKSTEGGRRIATDGHTYYGNVFGGGSGSVPYFDTTDGVSKYLSSAGTVKGNTYVDISGGHILTSVYGGCESTNVLGTANVTMTGGTLGVPRTPQQIKDHPVTCYLFGAGKGDQRIFFNKDTNVKDAVVKVEGGKIYGSVFGGGEDGHVLRNTTVTIGKTDGTGPTIGTVGSTYVDGNVFGGGRGFGGEALTAGNVSGSVDLTINGGTMLGSVYGGGRLASVGYGLYQTTDERYGVLRPDNEDDEGHAVDGFRRGHITVTVNGGTIGKEFGADVEGSEHSGNVFGGSMGRLSKIDGSPFDSPDHWNLLATAKTTTVNVTGGIIRRNVYGGGEMGTVVDDATVIVSGGTIGKAGGSDVETGNVFGGGKGISDNDAAGRVRSDTKVTVLGGTVYGDVYGGGALGKANTLSATNTASVNLLGGVIEGNAFGGGLGNATTAADVGNTRVNLNGMTDEEINGFSDNDFKTLLNTTLSGLKEYSKKGAVVKGSVFGANNVNGTPKGHVLVHVYATQNKDLATIKDKKVITSDEPTASDFDVTGVFGGGKQADYVPEPTDAMQSTEVIIEGCDLTSIYEVYGGGYGAATPGTNVLVKGTNIINNVFGGGYGAGNHTDTSAADYNPGANVGFRSDGTTAYGSGGKAVVQLMAGTVNHVYGGSNTLGNIRGRSNVTSVVKGTGDVSPGCCDHLTVLDIFGGGKSAEMFGGTEVVLGCMPDDWIGAIYAGAENANVGNDVSLTLTSGKFGRVFGGNKSGGTIDGYIEVNIEENPECSTPIIIGGLYGGGNEAPYTVPARYFTNNPNYQSPRVNVRAFTSIGNIYGGGFGASATVTGNPLVNINEVQGGREYAGEDKPLEDGTTVKLYARKADGKMGVIGNVFGGGNAAKVIGNTNVMIGTEAEQEMESLKTTDATTGTVTVVKKPVLGADIQGNVYGAGNNAEVTGHTNVVIGKKAE